MGIDRINQTVTEFLEQQRQQGNLPLPERQRPSRREELAESLMNEILTWIDRHNPSQTEAAHHALQSEAVNILIHVLAGELAVEELNRVWTEIINREPTEKNGWRFKEALDCRQREIASRLTEAIFLIGMQSPQAKQQGRKHP